MKQIMRLLSLGWMILGAPNALAITEGDYAKDFEEKIAPFYRSTGVTGEFTGAGGVKISYRKFVVPDEKGAIAVSLGRGESYLTHLEMEYDLTRAGYSVYVIDHRSQGFSGRTASDKQVVTVRSYDDYIADFETFMDTVVAKTPHPHLYLLGNSMGGLVAALYLAKHPTMFERAVLSAPMLEINTGMIPEAVALQLARFQVALGFGDRYASLGGQKPYDFDKRSDCYSPNGYDRRHCKIEELVRANPSSASGGSSYRWVRESLLATRRLRDGLGKQVTTPVLLLQAGRDKLVRAGGQDAFCAQASHCTKVRFAESSHGLLIERDEFRAPAYKAILDFFGSALKP